MINENREIATLLNKLTALRTFPFARNFRELTKVDEFLNNVIDFYEQPHQISFESVKSAFDTMLEQLGKLLHKVLLRQIDLVQRSKYGQIFTAQLFNIGVLAVNILYTIYYHANIEYGISGAEHFYGTNFAKIKSTDDLYYFRFCRESMLPYSEQNVLQEVEDKFCSELKMSSPSSNPKCIDKINFCIKMTKFKSAKNQLDIATAFNTLNSNLIANYIDSWNSFQGCLINLIFKNFIDLCRKNTTRNITIFLDQYIQLKIEYLSVQSKLNMDTIQTNNFVEKLTL